MDGFGQGADLVHFEEKGVAGFELDGLLDAERICDGYIVAVGEWREDVSIFLSLYQFRALMMF